MSELLAVFLEELFDYLLGERKQCPACGASNRKAMRLEAELRDLVEGDSEVQQGERRRRSRSREDSDYYDPIAEDTDD
jgi:hypothetical protein